MHIANTEKRFVLTHDSDFGTLAINEGLPCYGIIYLRLKNLKTSHMTAVLDRLLVVDQEIHEASLIVVEDTRLRIRSI
jgi:predicted nuclease of predicted toxin-antitoxin system